MSVLEVEQGLNGDVEVAMDEDFMVVDGLFLIAKMAFAAFLAVFVMRVFGILT